MARTRIAFWIFDAVVLLAAAGMLAFTSSAAVWVRGLAALGLAWIAGRDLALLRRARMSLALAPVNAAALLAVVAALGVGPATGVFFLGVFFRSLYGKRRHLVVNAASYVGVFLAGAFVLDGGGSQPLQTVLNDCAGLLFTAVVMGLVAAALRREEQTRSRERLLRHVGSALVAARTQEEVCEIALDAVMSLLAPEAAARTAIWREEGDIARAVAVRGENADSVRGATLALDSVPPEQREAIEAGRAIRVRPGTREYASPPLQYPEMPGEILIAPLRTQDEALGAMITSSEKPLPAAAGDTLLAIASLVALALESEQLSADAHRRESEERFASLIAHASDVISVVRPDGVITYQTASITRVLGYEPQALIGHPITDLIHPEDRPGAVAFLDRAGALAGATAMAEWRIAHRDGHWRHVEVVAGNLTGSPDVRGIVLTSRDMTERKALERRLAHQAFHDSLTGLPNRDLFRDRVEHALARSKRGGSAAVLFIDIDDFKNVNDTLGHASGDRMLALIAERLRGCVRSGDTAARLGGDEFGVLLEDAEGCEAAIEIATRLLSQLSQPLPLASRDTPVNASIGIALADHGVTSADELLRNADIAMYAAKQDGKSRLRVFEPDMYAQTVDRVELHHDLARAVARRELRLHYQPIVELGTGRPVGVEALVRWEHPQRGLLYPGDFISIAEESGLIVPIGRWVMHEACRQLRVWRQADPRANQLRMSVNLAPGQIAEPRVIDDVVQALRENDLEHDALIVEITESAVMEDLDVAVGRLDQLASLGVRLALDDFGTGYSSLSYLQRFPLDILKLDRAFTAQLGTGGVESQLPRAIIELAQTLGLSVVAEGVEEERQVTRLLELGCDRAQGFHFARPLPAAEAFDYVLEHHRRGEAEREAA